MRRATPSNLARTYLAAQSVLILAWWASLAAWPIWRANFTSPAVGGDRWLLGFAPADLITLIGGAIAALAWRAYVGRVGLVLCLIGISTQAIACLTVPFRTAGHDGWIGAIAMLLASIGTLACAGQMLAQADRRASMFRSALATHSSRTLAMQTIGQAAVLWTIFLLVLPIALVAVERAAGFAPPRSSLVRWSCGIVGGLLFVGGATLNIAAAVTMIRVGRGTPLPTAMANTLVIAGPYRRLRNPMAVGGLAQGMGVALLLASPLTAAYVVLGGLVWQLLIRPSEEADLHERFGDGFDAYRSAVRCWIPRRAAFVPSSIPAPAARQFPEGGGAGAVVGSSTSNNIDLQEALQ